MAEPWSDQHARFHQTLRSRGLLPIGTRVLVAVSGGQDSIGLLRLLVDLRRLWHWELVVGHCNHGWRSDATANGDFVIQLANDWGLPAVLAIWDAPQANEAAARAWRYDALSSLAQQHHCSTIVTGHTASDRAETLLHHLIRGSGGDGLGSLDWQRSLGSLQLVRPLLDWTRAETAEFCQTWQLPRWEDSTNQDQRYFRNRLRSQVLPLLRAAFNPQVERHLAQTAELLADEAQWLEQLTAQWLETHGHDRTGPGRGNGGDRLDRAQLQREPIALQRRVLRRWLTQQTARSPTYAQVAAVLALVNAPQGSQTRSLPQGAVVRVLDRWLIWLPAESSGSQTEQGDRSLD